MQSYVQNLSRLASAAFGWSGEDCHIKNSSEQKITQISKETEVIFSEFNTPSLKSHSGRLQDFLIVSYLWKQTVIILDFLQRDSL